MKMELKIKNPTLTSFERDKPCASAHKRIVN